MNPNDYDRRNDQPSEAPNETDVQNNSTEQFDAEPVAVSAGSDFPHENTNTAGVRSETTATTEASNVSPDPSSTTQPAVSTTPVAPMATKKKSKKPWIIGAIIAALLLVSGSAYAAYDAYQSPEKVVSDALLKALRADATQINASIVSDARLDAGGQEIAFKRLTIDTNGTTDLRLSTNAKAVIAVNGTDYEFAGSGMMADNGDLYFRIEKAVDPLKALFDEVSVDRNLPADAVATFRSLENKWVKVAYEDLRENDAKTAEVYRCSINVIKTLANDEAMQDELHGAYKSHPFMTTKGDARREDGLIGYEMTVDRKVAKDFAKAVENTAYGKKVKECDDNGSNTFDDAEDSVTDASSDTNATTIVWADQWSHELKRVTSTIKHAPERGNSNTTTVDARFGFDAKKKVTPPTDTISLDQFTTTISEGYRQIMDANQ